MTKIPLTPSGPATSLVAPSLTGYSIAASCIAQWRALTVSARNGFVDRSAETHGVQRKEHARLRVDVEVREGGGRERCDRGFVAPSLGLAAPADGDRRQRGGQDQRRRQHGDQPAKPRAGSALERELALVAHPLGDRLGIPVGDARVEELAFVLREANRGASAGLLGLREPDPRQQVVGASIRMDPFLRPGRDPRALAQSLPGIVDPAAQARPFAEQGFVCDLDRRLPRVGIAIEREQPVAPERLDDRIHRLRIGQRRELRTPDAATRVLRALAEGDQPQEQLPAGVSRALVHRFEQRLSPSRERAGHPADAPVGVEGERSAVGRARRAR